MKKVYSIIAFFVIITAIFAAVNFAFAEERELTPDDNAAFIVRDEWTKWTKEFTASLSALDKKATQKIYANMDYYDMQYRFTDQYKSELYLDSDGRPTELLKKLIKQKRKELGK